MSGTRNSPIVPARKEHSSDAREYQPRILVVDDEYAIADTVVKILNLSGYAATAAYDGDGALEVALLQPPEMLITDIVMPGMNGIDLAITMSRIYPDCRILLFSGQALTSDLMGAARRDGHNFPLLSKPVPPEDLLARVAEHFKPNRTGRTPTIA